MCNDSQEIQKPLEATTKKQGDGGAQSKVTELFVKVNELWPSFYGELIGVDYN